MHAAAYHSQPSPAAQGHTDPLYASVGHLLSKACSNTCSTAAQAFAQLVQPTARFQLALDALLPILDSQRSEVSELFVALYQQILANVYPLISRLKLPQRILVAYILYSLYASHPIAINPFKSVLFDTFTKERDAAIQLAEEGNASDNEQLVWVLWKVLKGDGDHVRGHIFYSMAASHSPGLARAIPSKHIGSRVTPIQTKSGELGPG